MTSSVQSAVFILAGSAISFCGIGFLALLYSSPATFVTVSTLGSLCLSAFIFVRIFNASWATKQTDHV